MDAPLTSKTKQCIQSQIQDYEERIQFLKEALEEDSQISAYEVLSLNFPFNGWDIWSTMKDALDRDPTQNEIMRVIETATDPKRDESYGNLVILVGDVAEDLFQSTPKND